jgi:uncharacterized protein YacL
MSNCILNIKTVSVIECVIGTGALPTSAIMSWSIGSIQPLIAGSAITVLVGAIGLIVGLILRQLHIVETNLDQTSAAILSSGIAYIILAAASLIAGIIPGGILGIALLVASVAISVWSVKWWADNLAFCFSRARI